MTEKKNDKKRSAAKSGAAPRSHARWIEAAMLVPSIESPLSVPYEVFLDEARGAASFLQRYWKARGDVPGLARVRRKLPRATSAEITELVSAVQQAQTDATLAVVSTPEDPTARAEWVTQELASALAFTLDDGVEDDDDARYAKVRAFHAKRDTLPTSIGQDLLNHATLASSLRARLVHDDEDFDDSLIDEALGLSARLSAASIVPPAIEAEPSPPPTPAPLALRNRLLHLLVARVALVRRGARRVFQKHPEILAEVTSAHERERRAESRKKTAEGEGETPAQPAVPTAAKVTKPRKRGR